MTLNEQRLATLDDRLAALQSSLAADRLRVDELEIRILSQQRQVHELQDERRVLKAHVDRVRTVVRRVA